MEWNFKEGLPIYSQIIEEMCRQIASGAYKPGDKLPSVRDMAADAGVNPNTMQRALAELERRGLVFTERTSGRFITKEEGNLKEVKKTLGMRYVAELFENLRKIGLSDDEIIKAVNEWKEGVK